MDRLEVRMPQGSRISILLDIPEARVLTSEYTKDNSSDLVRLLPLFSSTGRLTLVQTATVGDYFSNKCSHLFANTICLPLSSIRQRWIPVSAVLIQTLQ